MNIFISAYILRYFYLTMLIDYVDCVGGFYPAPYKILEVLEKNYGKSKDEHLKAEANAFCDLAATDVSAVGI